MAIRKITVFLLLIISALIITEVYFWYHQRFSILCVIWSQQQNGEVFDITFAPNNQFCVSGGIIWDKKQNKKRSAIYLWRVEDGTLMFVLKGDLGGYVRSLAISPDGRLLASNEVLFMLSGICGTQVDLLKLWKVSGNTLIKLLERYDESNPVFSPNQRFLATCSGLEITFWQVEGNHLIKVRKLTAHTNLVTSITFSSNGDFLASGDGDGIIKIWKFKDGSLVRTLKGHDGYISTIAFSPNGQFLALGSDDGTVKLWQVKDGKLIETFMAKKLVKSIAFTPDSAFLVAASALAVTIWRVRDGSIVWQWLASNPESSSPSALAISHDGSLLAVGFTNGSIRVWRMQELK